MRTLTIEETEEVSGGIINPAAVLGIVQNAPAFVVGTALGVAGLALGVGFGVVGTALNVVGGLTR